MRSKTWVVAASLSASLVVGCRDVTPPSPLRNYGFMSLDVVPGGGGYVTDPSGLFFRSAPLALGRLSTGEEGCDLSTFGDGDPAPVTHVNAGATITVTIGGNNVVLVQDQIDEVANIGYIRAVGSPLPLTPGDQFEVTIPGGAAGEFPAMTAIGQTATLITPDPITVPDSGQPLVATWPAGTSGASVVVYELTYKSSSTATALDRQLFCVFTDDGSALIDYQISDGWRRSVTREAVVSRFSIVALHQDNSYLYVSSGYSVATPILAP